MGYLLVTNDDGVDCPTLPPLVRALRELAEVRVVVPTTERSWISKAITRWDELRVERVEREGIEILAVHGFPADCTNLGVHSLFDAEPEMVVSGINLGLNVGLGFFLSSGTVGAASEGWIAGIPAIALSVGTWGSDREWKRDLAPLAREGVWERVAVLSADIVRSVREIGFPEGVDLLSVNFPLDAGLDTPRVVTGIAAVGYDRLFRRKEAGVYVHDYGGGLRVGSELDGTDIAALADGRVSITPIRLAHTARLPSEIRRLLERCP